MHHDCYSVCAHDEECAAPAESTQPEDWDTEEDGEWEAPSIPNPKCKDAPGCGPWTRPQKPNPAYKGKWSAPLIDNPEYKARTLSKGFPKTLPVVGSRLMAEQIIMPL